MFIRVNTELCLHPAKDSRNFVLTFALPAERNLLIAEQASKRFCYKEANLQFGLWLCVTLNIRL